MSKFLSKMNTEYIESHPELREMFSKRATVTMKRLWKDVDYRKKRSEIISEINKNRVTNLTGKRKFDRICAEVFNRNLTLNSHSYSQIREELYPTKAATKWQTGLQKYYEGNIDRVGVEIIANHKVKEIIFSEDKEDVYDLTINGTHNFALDAGVFVHNSVDGDPPAAMRYTEAKMAKITVELLNDLEKGTVPYVLNYDGTRLEPTVLPANFPQLLSNGTDGIAVGMATKIPPHNLKELIAALIEMIKRGNKYEPKAIYNELRLAREKKETIPMTLDSKPTDYHFNYVNANDPKREQILADIQKRIDAGEPLYPSFKAEITPEELIEIVPGPDFPTGGTIYDRNESLNAYATGRGRILQRAKASIEEGAKGRFQIIVTEIPYQVNKAYLIEKIADLVKDKKVEGISDIRDESSSREGMRVVVILKKDANPKTVLNKLYKYTEMQKVFSANMISLVDGQPQTLSLKQMLELFLSFRMVIVIRRFEYEIAESKYRAHILEGLLKALDILDEVIATIRGSKTQEEAKTNLIEKFEFTEVQAQAILDMQLRKLAALEREKLQNEFNDLSGKIEELSNILADENKVLAVVESELKAISEKHGDERKTKVIKGKVDEIEEEDLIASEDTLVTISQQGYIKRINPIAYKTQHRGGKGVTGATTKEDDYIAHATLANTHDELMLFTNKGRVFKIRVFEVPEYGRTAKGLPLVNLIALEQDELVTSLLTMTKGGVRVDNSSGDKKKVFKYLFMATRKGTVKKTDISDFAKIRNSGLIAAKLEGEDELLWVKPTTGEDDVILVSKEGKNIRFNEKDVRATGRNTIGVRGMKFKTQTDNLISMDIISDNNGFLFTLSENGYGKMSGLSEYAVQGRGGSGVFTFRVKPKTGNLVVARVVIEPENTEIVVISEQGQVIRSHMKAIPTLGRCMNLISYQQWQYCNNSIPQHR